MLPVYIKDILVSILGFFLKKKRMGKLYFKYLKKIKGLDYVSKDEIYQYQLQQNQLH